MSRRERERQLADSQSYNRDVMESSIEEFASRFRRDSRNSPWVLWIGSAISCASPARVPLAGPIVRALVRYLAGCGTDNEPHDDMLRNALCDFGASGALRLAGGLLEEGAREGWRMPFEAILGEVSEHTGDLIQAFLEDLVPSAQAAQPNPNHAAIASLASAGLVDFVVTTNFDECLEPVWPGGVLVSTQEAFGTPSASPLLIKVHGTISDFASVAVNPDALAKRARAEWQESLADVLRNRRVLFVGYGFQDRYDILPGLRLANQAGATFYWADRYFPRDLPFEAMHLIRTDLSEPEQNVLLVLSRSRRLRGTSTWPSIADQEEHTLRILQRTGAAPSVAQRLKEFAALYYWLEDGRNALSFFRAARTVGHAAVDTHTIARACVRARRYRKAFSLFKRMLQYERPSDGEQRVTKVVDWNCGAAHCAAAGGRIMLAERYYREAEKAIREAGKSPEELTPYLMDQLLRGRAENLLRIAVQTWSRRARDERLAIAERDLTTLASNNGRLDLRVRYLIERGLGRIDILRGNPEAAIDRLLDVKDFFESWGDPDGLATTNRDIAIARTVGRFRALVPDALEARRRGRWLEWVKIQATRVGLTGYGPLAPFQMRLRSLSIAAYDAVKELGISVGERRDTDES